MQSPSTLQEFYLGVYKPRRLVGGSLGTNKLYRIALAQFSDYLGHPAFLADLTEENLSGFMAWYIIKHSAVTCEKTTSRLMALARYAFRKRMLEEEPEIRYPKGLKRIPQAYRPEQIGRMLSAASQLSGRIHKTEIPAADWWVALIHVAYWTGLRTNAMLAIQQSFVDLPEGTLFVPAETQKQRADQLFRLHPDCLDAIRQIWEPRREMLFPWRQSLTTLYRRFREILRAVDLPTGRRDLFQRIRRTTYTYSKLGGIDAGHQLGHHSDMSAHYEDPTITQQRQACDVLPRPELPKPKLRVIG